MSVYALRPLPLGGGQMPETTFWVALVGAVSAVTGPLLTFQIVRHRRSGRVNTTEADALWKEAGDLRREYQTEISELRALLEESRREHAAERTDLKAEITRLRSELHERDTRINHLEVDREKLTHRVTELEGELRMRAAVAATAVNALPTTGDA